MIGELFSVMRGRRHVVNNHEDGELPYYAASLENNGVTDYIGNPLFVESDAVVITTFGDAFWANGSFTASDECTILKHKYLNEMTGLFVSSTYVANNKRKYSFKLKAFSGRVVEDIVFLPTTITSDPNWNYMEQYIKQVMDKEEAVVNSFLAICPKK